MNPNREELLFAAAMERPPEKRADFLDGACLGDDALRKRVEELLAAHDATANLLHTAAGQAPTIKLDLADAPDEAVGQTLGRYKLLERVGEGGCGVVYVAEQTEPVRRRVALKVIKLGMDTQQVVARFEAERQALAMMDHPNIAKVLDAGTTDVGRPFFVMELVRGIRITDYCDQAHLSTKERLDLFIKVCQAIQHAHQKGIIHRDIKPSNILVTLHDGVPVPKVIDFGIAKATEGRLTDNTVYTQLHQFIGTPAYMSPEQAEMSGLDIDTRSDIYSLGVLLYELLAGSTPFDAKELMASGIDAMRKTIREKEPQRPSTRLATLGADLLTTTAKRRGADTSKLLHQLQGDLDWIVMKCLEKDRQRRYETANGLAADLKRHLDNEPVVARPPSAAYKFQKAVRRNRLAYGAGAAVAAALLLGLGLSLWQARRAQHAEADAQRRLTEAEAISKFMTEVFQSPDPARDGRTITVAETLDAAAKKLETDLAAQPDRQAQLRATLGQTYASLGLYRQAIALREKVRNYYLGTGGPEHPATIRAAHALLETEALDGGGKDRVAEWQELLRLSRKVNGPEHIDTLHIITSVAYASHRAGRIQEAIALHESALPLYRRVLGPEHPDTLEELNLLAMCYFGSGRHAEALRQWEELLPVTRRINGPNHPRALDALHNVAFGRAKLGRAAEALSVYREVTELSRKISGPDHVDTLVSMLGVASTCRAVGRTAESIRLGQAVVAGLEAAVGSEHPETLNGMMELGSGYQQAGRHQESLLLLEKVLVVRNKDEASGRSKGFVLQELAETHRAAGHLAEAVESAKEAHRLIEATEGAENAFTLESKSKLAHALQASGRLPEALRLREETLRLERKVQGPEAPATLAAMKDLAESYFSGGRQLEAFELLRTVLKSNPKDGEAILTLVSWQNWHDQPADRNATLERAASVAEQIDAPIVRIWTALAFAQVPATNPAFLTLAVRLANLSLAEVDHDPVVPWFHLALGLAQYRSGLLLEAEASLNISRNLAGESFANARSAADLVRAMVLLKQGKAAEAKAILGQLEETMPALRSAGLGASTEGIPHNREILLVHLLYREAVGLTRNRENMEPKFPAKP